MRAAILGASVWGPGLEGWEASRAVLTGESPYKPCDSPPPAPSLLSSNERRRASPHVRLALAVAQQASAAAGIAPGAVTAIFATANGDATLVASLLDVLAGAQPQVSPTQFHNSVHNAAAGYWSIGNRSFQEVTSIAAHDWTFAAALLKAAAHVGATRSAVLLCAADAPLPPPLATRNAAAVAFGAGLVLAPSGHPDALAEITLEYDPEPASPEAEAALPPLRDLARASPAARALRLLQALARREAAAFALALIDGSVGLAIEPC